MKKRGERSVIELYDRTQIETKTEGRCVIGGNTEGSDHEIARMKQDKSAARKRLISTDSPPRRTESGTCNVCSAPCSSCLHRSLVESKVECGSSDTCCVRAETDTCSFIGSSKRPRSKGRESDDQLSASSSQASHSEKAGNKHVVRSSVVGDSSEVDMPSRAPLGRSDGEDQLLTGKTVSSSAPSTGLLKSDSKRRRLSNQDAGVHRAECHDDNISCLTGTSAGRKLSSDMKHNRLCSSASSRDLLAKKCKDSGTNKSHSPESPINQNKLPNRCTEESPRKRRFDPHEMCTNSHEKPVPAVLTSCATQKLRRAQSSVGVAQGLSPQKQDADLGDSPKKLVAEPCGKPNGLKDHAEDSFGGRLAPRAVGSKRRDTNFGANNTNNFRTQCSSKDQKNDDSCLREEVQASIEVQSKDDVNCSDGDKQDQKQNCSLNASNDEKSKMENEAATDLVDVDVCDICGDLGREELLATCSTCLYGAEHTYCMRVKLEKVPEGDWLCEECQLKETEKIRISNLQRTCGTSTAEHLNGKNHNSQTAVNNKKLQVNVIDSEARQSREGPESQPKPCKKHTENISSIPSRKVSENSPKPLDTTSPTKHGVSSRENSFKKYDDGSRKLADNASERDGKIVKSSQTLLRSYSLGNLSKVQMQIPSPRGVLSKQFSFNTLNVKPKVKQLTVDIPSKLKIAKCSPREAREKGLFRKITKSTSFKIEGSARKNVSSLKQRQSLRFAQSEEPGILKPMKGKNLLEKKGSFSLEKPNIPSSPRSGASVKAVDLKTAQQNAKSESSVPKIKNSKNTGSSERKLSPAKDQKPTGVVSGKYCYGAKTTVFRNSGESGKKENKRKFADEAAGPKAPVKNKDGIPKMSKQLSMLRANKHCEIFSQDTLLGSSSLENLTWKGISDQQDVPGSTGESSSKIEKAMDVREKSQPEKSCKEMGMTEDTEPDRSDCFPGECDLETTIKGPNEPDAKPSTQALCDQSSLTGNPSRALVIPERNYVWRGSFEILRPGRSPEMFYGMQAHLSTCVSPKVQEVVRRLPDIFQLEEVPRVHSWPLQFREVKPNEDNIALFFFAEDLESYERTYRKLLERMITDDSSLKGNIYGVELLIFPSDQLPENSQRWNNLFFLWGVFRARKLDCPRELPDIERDPRVSKPSSDIELCCPKVLPSGGIDLNESPDDEFCTSGLSPELKAEKHSASAALKPFLDPEHEGKKPDAHNLYALECVSSGKVESECSAATVSGAYLPMSTRDHSNMILACPDPLTDRAGTSSGDKMAVEKYIDVEGPLCVEAHADHGVMHHMTMNQRPIKKLAHSPFMEALAQPSTSRSADEATAMNPTTNFISLEGESVCKRSKFSDKAHSGGTLGDERLPSRLSSKIHPLPANDIGQSRSVDGQYGNAGAAVPGPLKKPLCTDDVVLVLSSDDEDLPQSSTHYLGVAFGGKSSSKAEGSTLLSLSFAGTSSEDKLANHDTGGDDESLSLSLALPGLEKGKREPAFEIKHLLPEEPGVNTSLFL